MRSSTFWCLICSVLGFVGYVIAFVVGILFGRGSPHWWPFFAAGCVLALVSHFVHMFEQRAIVREESNLGA